MLHRVVVALATVLHRIYKMTLSPLLGNVCRFTPYCSDYALEAVTVHGLFKGSWLALRRVCRCHPLHPGGVDPVPDKIVRTPACATGTRFDRVR